MTEQLARYERVLDAALYDILATEFKNAEDLLQFVDIPQMIKLLTNEELGVLLNKTTGMREDIASDMHRPTADAFLARAHGQGQVTAKQIFDAITQEVLLKRFPHLDLWNFVVESGFWKLEKGHAKFNHAELIMRRLIQTALSTELIDPATLLHGPMADELAEHLPQELKATMTKHLLKGVNDTTLLEEVIRGPETILKHVPLSIVWEHVVVRHIASAMIVGGNSIAPK